MNNSAADLIEWYWHHGCKRSGPYRVLPSWLIGAYQCHAIECSLQQESNRYGVAVWGPSQTGKSTFLSTFIDGKDDLKSALMWDDKPFVFSAIKKAQRNIGLSFGWALNPHSGGNDASACVTRFFGADSVEYPTFPVEVHFAGRRQVLHSIAAGYMSECDLRLSNDPQRVWEVDELRALLPREITTRRADRNASELLMDALYVVDRLLAEQNIRYLKLNTPSATAEGTEWENRLKDGILGNPALASDGNKAFEFVATLLWDQKPALTSFLRGIEAARRRLDEAFAGKHVRCSLEVAHLFLDMETYRCLENVGSPAQEKVDYVNDAVAAVRYQERDGSILIDTSATGQKLFAATCSFAHVQSLLWEMSVPLNNAFLEKSSPDVKAFLASADLLDIPGVSNRPAAEKDSLIDVSKPVEDVDLFLKIFKRGKTACIINRFAEEGAIDQLLLLLRSDREASQPNQLVTGIKTIWRELDPAYEVASKAPPPAPLTLALTFFNKIVDLAAEAAGSAGDPSALGPRLNVLGNVIAPEVCRTFVMCYPQFAEGRSKLGAQELETVRQEFAQSGWIVKRFPTEIERNSIANLLQQADETGDGGVSYLLRHITSTIDSTARSRNVAGRHLRFEENYLRLVTAVAPAANQEAERARTLIKRLGEDLSKEISSLAATRAGKSRLVEISSALRKSFSFLPEEMQALPAAAEDIAGYVDAQINVWMEHAERDAELEKLGVPKQDRIALLEAVSRIIDRPAVATTLSRIVSGIRRPDPEYFVHATSFVAAALNSELRGGQGYFDDQPASLSHSDFVSYCNSAFPRWMDPNGIATDNPHYQLIVQPALKRLGTIGETIGAGGRPKDLAGDDEIAVILKELQGEASTAQVPA